ncbi:MAG: histidinol-phosphate aminotransferase family protein [Prevotella sp.]|nr:histidinol-phosphate aminotransferase family protein [Prevotella sp.]MBR6715637.1 histidinol-phosphate aminotransferase family protein [Prevotella sp.]
MNEKMNFLDRNEFNFEPSDEVKEVIKNFDYRKLCFYTRIYDQGKKSIFSVYLSELYDIDEHQIILGYGAEDLLKKTVHYFLTLGGSKTMLIPKFSWWYYKSIADEVHGTTLQYPVYENGNTFTYDFEGIKKMVDELQPKILLVASPNNPTGNALTPAEMEKMVDMVPQSTILLVDEAYASFLSSDASYVKMLIEKHPNIIICRTMSKFYGLPGLRMGFGFIGQGEEMEHFAKYANMYLGYDRLSEDIAIAAIKSDAHYREIAQVMQDARDMYTNELGALPGFKVYQSLANFILVKYPIELKEALQKEFANESYKVKFMNEPGIDTHMRITLGRAEQNRKVCDIILKIAKS